MSTDDFFSLFVVAAVHFLLLEIKGEFRKSITEVTG